MTTNPLAYRLPNILWNGMTHVYWVCPQCGRASSSGAAHDGHLFEKHGMNAHYLKYLPWRSWG